MKKHINIRTAAALNLVLVLGVAFWQITKKEHILNAGEEVLFRLAPVDPRSLMQGDFMRLRYAVSELREADTVPLPSRGLMAVRYDENREAQELRVVSGFEDRRENELIFKFYASSGRLKFAADSYFFEEGKADLFAEAVYGGLRISEDGECLLEGMYDKNRERIED